MSSLQASGVPEQGRGRWAGLIFEGKQTLVIKEECILLVTLEP